MDGCQFSSITTNMKKINSWQAERQLLPNRITVDKRERERERERERGKNNHGYRNHIQNAFC
jgi:hypothetical protein